MVRHFHQISVIFVYGKTFFTKYPSYVYMVRHFHQTFRHMCIYKTVFTKSYAIFVYDQTFSPKFPLYLYMARHFHKKSTIYSIYIYIVKSVNFIYGKTFSPNICQICICVFCGFQELLSSRKT